MNTTDQQPAQAMKLYSGPLSMFGAKALIAALEKGAGFELVMVPFDTADRYQPKHGEVLRINPKRQVPVLVDGDLELFDSTLIFEYLEDRFPEPALWPSEPVARARARLLELQSDEVYFPYVVRLMHLQYDLQAEEPRSVITAAEKYYEQMDALLADRAYLAGPYTYADIAFYMAALFGERMGAPVTDATPRLLAWRERMTARDAVARGVLPLVRHLREADRPVPQFLAHLGA